MVCAKNPLTADVSCGERHQYQSGESKTLKGFDLCLIQRIPLNLCFSGNSLQVLFTDNGSCGLLMKRRARADCVTWTIYGYTAELRFMAVNVIAHVISYFASTADQRYVTSPNCRQ